ncbi:MAG: hypothetical protein GW892_34450 [Armatimonadetes bacterium]|nr:hypothetical protein [Armatimonadota bacterium]NCP34721.1 hypothetical protein [Armatimonadota bacterium]
MTRYHLLIGMFLAPLAGLLVSDLPRLGAASAGTDAIALRESRAYRLDELAEALGRAGGNYAVDRRQGDRLLFVSAGSYPCPALERGIEEASGLRWRQVGEHKFLGYHLDTPPDEETKDFASTLLAELSRGFSFGDAPLTAADFRPDRADRDKRVVAFWTLTLDQQLWLAGRAAMMVEGAKNGPTSQRPLTPAELREASVTFRFGVAVVMGQFVNIGRDENGAELFKRMQSTQYGLRGLRAP